MLIKVCGIAREANMREVAGLGPDFMGFIFYPPSPRNACRLSAEAVRALPPGIGKVGVFVDESPEAITRIAEAYGLDWLQFHGNESPADCRKFSNKGYKIIKAFGIASSHDLDTARDYEGVCDLLVFDTQTPLKGGSGEKFDHSLLGSYRGRTPYLLSGGIGTQDAGQIGEYDYTDLAGLDINSRFETEPGLKDIGKLDTFISSIRKKS